MDKKLQQQLKESLSRPVEISEAHMKQTVSKVQLASRGIRARNRIGFGGFLLRQLWNMGMGVWIPQLCALLLIYIMMKTAPAMEQTAYIPLLCCSAVLIAMTGLPMWSRARKYNMLELELSTRMSTGRLMLARMIITGASNFAALVIVLVIAGGSFHSDLGQMAFYLLLPYLAACCVCVPVLQKLRGAFTGWICGAVCLCLMTVFYSLFRAVPEFYALDGAWAWQAVCVLLAGVLAWQVWRTLKRLRTMDGLIDTI